MMNLPDFASMTPLVLALGLVWVALVFDLRQRRIPNVLTFAGAGLGFTALSLAGGVGGMTAALAGLAVGMFILMPGFLLRMTGAGDVKLMAAVGAFLGPYWVLVAGVASIVVGSLIALTFLASALLVRNVPSPWARYDLMLRGVVGAGRISYIPPADGEIMGRRFPFAVSIALGTTLTLLLLHPLTGLVGTTS